MPRPLVFGNGSLLIGIDERYVIRDLYYPQVGLPNHLSGHPIRMGFYVGGRFAWSDDPGWKQDLRYEPETLVGATVLRNESLGIEVKVREAVAPQSPYYVRQMEIRNLGQTKLDVLSFFSHDVRIAASDIGDTAFYNPYLDGVVHYKGPYYLLFGGSTALGGLHEYTTGIKDFGGLEGTWRDAEDGRLSGNPIAQGSVDSTFSLRAEVEPLKTSTMLYWIVCGKDLEDTTRSYRKLVHAGFAETLTDTARFWKAWVGRPVSGLETLPAECQNLFHRSLLTIRTQIDNQGAVIAANDTDIMKTNRATYSYMWPRDGALVSHVMDRVGFQQLGRRFFQFCDRVMPTDRPILMHKYGPDGSLGASWHPWIANGRPEVPFQEDETALTVHALWEHYSRHQDLEFLGELYESFVVPACDFMARYRDPGTHLPLPCWDLWEERRGVHTFTVAALVSAMRAASNMAQALGDEREPVYLEAADQLARALVERLFDQQTGCFLRSLRQTSEGVLEPDRTVDSSVLAVALFRALPADHEMVRSTVRVVEQRLRLNSAIDGVARYEGDYYFRRSERYPGNPWIICTLWLAQAKILMATSQKDLAEPLRWLQWTCERAASTGILAEQVHPDTGEPLSVSPLTWSHAEYVSTVLEYLDKVRELVRPA